MMVNSPVDDDEQQRAAVDSREQQQSMASSGKQLWSAVDSCGRQQTIANSGGQQPAMPDRNKLMTLLLNRYVTSHRNQQSGSRSDTKLRLK